MKTALQQYIEDLKNGNCKGEEYYIELERNQIVDAHESGQDIVVFDSGFTDSITYFEKKYSADKQTIKK